ncbi:hypothetical protein ACI2LF_25710 [Kribbella sp. NPDC020789]
MSSRLLRLKLRAMQSRRYWHLRALRQIVGTRTASVRIAGLSRTADFSSLVRIGGLALAKSPLLILPSILALVLTQSVARLHGRSLTWAQPLPEWAGRLLAWITSPVSATFDAAALPSGAIEVAGVFVAVYFATVTFVVSTTYKDATRRLRDQIVRQPESRWYAAFFTPSVVYVGLALALPVVDQVATHLTLLAAGLTGALVVLSFGRIWITLFVSLEPTSLFPPIQRDLNRWIHRAHKLGTRKAPSSTSIRRANEKIRDKLATLDDLVTLILDREYERAADRGIAASFDPRIRTALQHLMMIWDAYARRKHTIVPLPGWNPARIQEKDWFLSSHSEVDIAVATGTGLNGKQVVDDLWYERRVATLIERLLSGRDLLSVERALGGLTPLSRTLGQRGQFDELRLWLTATTFAPMTIASQYAAEMGVIKTPTVTGDGRRSHLSRAEHFALPGEASAHNLVDVVLLEVLNASLGYTDYFQRMQHLLAEAGTIVANDKSRVIAGRLVLEIVKNLRDALANESRFEGERVTPDNALAQLTARALATETLDELQQLLTYLEKELWPWVIEVGGSKSWAAGAALSRATELTEKLETTFEFARRLLDACEAAHIDKDDRWPATDSTDARLRARSLRDQLELPVARLATTIDTAPDSDRPDHFGWAYYRAHENLLRRLLSREPGEPEALRQQVFLLYLSTDLATQRLSATIRNNDQRLINSYIAEPYLRFLQLSGIALILSELADAPEMFRPFETSWSALLTDVDKSTVLLGRAAATLASSSGLLALTPGSLTRSNIEIRANNALEELGVPHDLFDFDGFHTYENENPSPFSDNAQRMLRSLRSSQFEGMFYARWLRPHAVAAGASVPSEVEQYLHLLDLDPEEDAGS